MAKQTGFIVTATYLVPIDKKDFAKQAAAYAAMAEIEKNGTLPADFTGTLIGVKAKQGSADIPAEPVGTIGGAEIIGNDEPEKNTKGK